MHRLAVDGLGLLLEERWSRCHFLWYLRFNVLAIIRDLSITAAAKHILFSDLYQLNSIALEAGIGLLITLGACSFLIDSGKPQIATRMFVSRQWCLGGKSAPYIH